MPELPDVTVYVRSLTLRVLGEPLQGVRLTSPFLLRTVDPPLETVRGRRVREVRRLGKRIVLSLEPDLHLVIHLMIAGRLRWRDPGATIPRRLGLAAFDFPAGTLLFTEAGTKKRASLHLVQGPGALEPFDRGGLEVLESTPAAFDAALRRENHTLKRGLTDPRILSGIGNAYSDEILHRARLSPLRLTSRLTPGEMDRLHRAVIETLTLWTDRLTRETGDRFPETVTAFHDAMAVHGRFGKPCPDCGAPVQRIVYTAKECNYCPRCQTQGRVLADRSLSRLLKKDWPRDLDSLEERFPGRGVRPDGD
jgi:formamidopyrimidine-DNA glycosylase